MIAAPAPNLMSRPYRGLSVQEVGFALTERALMSWIAGRKVYRRTEFILVRNESQGALITVARHGGDLFGPVREARVLAGPGELVMLDSPETDVGNATALAEVAGRHRHRGADRQRDDATEAKPGTQRAACNTRPAAPDAGDLEWLRDPGTAVASAAALATAWAGTVSRWT
jgi:hypothetical protein